MVSTYIFGNTHIWQPIFLENHIFGNPYITKPVYLEIFKLPQLVSVPLLFCLGGGSPLVETLSKIQSTGEIFHFSKVGLWEKRYATAKKDCTDTNWTKDIIIVFLKVNQCKCQWSPSWPSGSASFLNCWSRSKASSWIVPPPWKENMTLGGDNKTIFIQRVLLLWQEHVYL